jgi:hypothetical protein
MFAWAVVESITWISGGLAIAGTFLLVTVASPGLTLAQGRGWPLLLLGIVLLVPAVWYLAAVFAHPPELVIDAQHRRCWICNQLLGGRRLPD